MICVRCGWCCQNLAVVLPDGTIHLGQGQDCKFLRWEGNKAVCTVHGELSVIKDEQGRTHRTPWKRTPCGSHGQIEHRNTRCRMGVYVRKRYRRGSHVQSL